MTPQITAFRSQKEREKENKLLAHYKAIGIASIAAASAAIRRPALQNADLRLRHAD